MPTQQNLYIPTPELEQLHKAAKLRFNAYITGPHGAGKTSLLNQFASERPNTTPVIPADTTDRNLTELLKNISSATDWVPDILETETNHTPRPGALDIMAYHTNSRRDGRFPEPAIILLDNPDREHMRILFGRWRDTLWELRTRWFVVSTEPTPPHGGFFDRTVTLQPWTQPQLTELIAAHTPNWSEDRHCRTARHLAPSYPGSTLRYLHGDVKQNTQQHTT